MPVPGMREPASVRLRIAILADLDAIAAIEAQSFHDGPWSRSALAWVLQAPHTRCVVACAGAPENVVGYIVTALVVDAAEIMNLAVAPPWRTRGIGTQLVDAALATAAAGRARVLHLEVRESNAAARAIYASRGFVSVGRRRAYYRNPVEDALVLERRWERTDVARAGARSTV
jgi:ribosomal-protein-alanine N-acetyltransferase